MEDTGLQDVVDGFVDAYAADLGLDPEVEGLVVRLHKLSYLIKRTMRETAESLGLTLEDWDVLGALWRAGPPYRRSPSELAKRLSLSSGAMTARLDRLEKMSYVRRIPDPADRRSVRAELTDEGLASWERTVDVQAAKEKVIAGSLTEEEKRGLNDLLRKLMIYFEEQPGFPLKRDI